MPGFIGEERAVTEAFQNNKLQPLILKCRGSFTISQLYSLPVFLARREVTIDTRPNPIRQILATA